MHRIRAVFSPLLPPRKRSYHRGPDKLHLEYHSTPYHIPSSYRIVGTSWNMFVPLHTAHWHTDSRRSTRRKPIHTEYFHSDGATTLSFSSERSQHREYPILRPIISGTIFVPLDNTALAHNPTTTTGVVSPVHKGEKTFNASPRHHISPHTREITVRRTRPHHSHCNSRERT